MLPSQNRLLLRTDFAEVKKKGLKFQGKFFGLLTQPTKQKTARFGFILSTKISKKSQQRNRARRLLREAVRKILPKVKGGFDIVFLAKKEILGQSLPGIQTEIKKVFTQAKLLPFEDEN